MNQSWFDVNTSSWVSNEPGFTIEYLFLFLSAFAIGFIYVRISILRQRGEL